ncbi:methyltransferase domain-containing protein [Candidatus Woesearchaeota archaeon]|nr:methyltransferase domain-containing protein [Candidatus Woesearchaeota archaeon]
MPKDWSEEFVHHWKYFIGPARPGPSELEKIRQKILEKGEDAKVLILGSTSEYRNLLGELGIPVTLIDFKRYNYEHLSDEVENMPQERFIEGDWLSTVLDEKFDIILADNVLNIVCKKDLRELLKNVSKMLEPNGYFLPRTYIRRKGEKIDPVKVIEKYREKRDGESFYTWTARDLYIAVYDTEKDCATLKDVWTLIKSLHDKGLFTDRELEEWRKNSFENRELTFYMPSEDDLDKALKEFFRIVEVFNGTEEYLKGDVPLHILKPK